MPQKMTLREVQLDLRSRGLRMSQVTIAESIRNGTFTFGSVLGVGATGRTTFLIIRSDYEKWAAEKFPSKEAPTHSNTPQSPILFRTADTSA